MLCVCVSVYLCLYVLFLLLLNFSVDLCEQFSLLCWVHFPSVIIIINHLKTIITIRRFIQILLHFFLYFFFSLHFLFFSCSFCVSFVSKLWHILLRPSCTLMYFSNLHTIPTVHLLYFVVVLLLLEFVHTACGPKVRFLIFFFNWHSAFVLVCVTVDVRLCDEIFIERKIFWQTIWIF